MWCLLPAPLIDALEAQQRSVRQPEPIGTGRNRRVVRAQTPKPISSTPEALRAALTGALDHPCRPAGHLRRSHIARRCSSNGTSPRRRSADRPKSAISGGAELMPMARSTSDSICWSEVLTVKGVCGRREMLPPALQNYIVYAGAVLADSPAPEAAAEFIRFRRRRPVAGAAMEDKTIGLREPQPELNRAGPRPEPGSDRIRCGYLPRPA